MKPENQNQCDPKYLSWMTLRKLKQFATVSAIFSVMSVIFLFGYDTGRGERYITTYLAEHNNHWIAIPMIIASMFILVLLLTSILLAIITTLDKLRGYDQIYKLKLYKAIPTINNSFMRCILVAALISLSIPTFGIAVVFTNWELIGDEASVEKFRALLLLSAIPSLVAYFSYKAIRIQSRLLPHKIHP